MEKMRIKRRILIPLGVSLLALLAVTFLGIRQLVRRDVDELAQVRLDDVQAIFQSMLDRDVAQLSGLLHSLEGNKHLQEAWLAKDRDMLLSAAVPVFEDFRSQHPADVL